MACLEGRALLTWTVWMDDVRELPAGAAGFTDTGQNWYLNGPDWFLMVLTEWRRDQKVSQKREAAGFTFCTQGKFHMSELIEKHCPQSESVDVLH